MLPSHLSLKLAGLIAALVLAAPALAQTTPRVNWRLSTSPSLSVTQTCEPALWSAPQPSLAVFCAQNALGLRATNLEDAGEVGPLGAETYAAIDERNGVLLVSTKSTGTLLLGTLPTDGGVTPDFWDLTISSPDLVALSDEGDGGLFAWYSDSTNTVRITPGTITFDPTTSAWSYVSGMSQYLLPEPVTGLAADDRTRALYVAQRQSGVIRIAADGTQDYVISIDAGTLGASVEGLDLYPLDDGGVLLFSATGISGANGGLIAVHRLDQGQATSLGFFEVGDPDGGPVVLTATRFLDVHTGPLVGFPNGALLLEDYNAGTYKVLDLDEVRTQLALPPVEAFPDAGDADGGACGDGGACADGGAAGDGGTSPDGGAGSDAGSPGAGGGSGGSHNDCTGQEDCRQPRPVCGCASGPLSVFTLLALAWWRRRST